MADINLSTEELEELMNTVEEWETPLESERLESKPAEYTNFKNLEKECVKYAKGKIKKLVEYNLTADMMKHPWTIRKVSLDIYQLSNLHFQSRTSKYAIIKNLEEIDAGAVNYQTLKVFADLQKQNMEIMRNYKQYIQILETEYQTFAENYNNENLGKIEKNVQKREDLSEIHRGTASILKELDEIIEGEVE